MFKGKHNILGFIAAGLFACIPLLVACGASPAAAPVVIEKEVVVEKEEELLQDITWTTVADEDRIFSISVPSEWETNVDSEELSAEMPRFEELGAVALMKSIVTETGSNLLMILDANYIFA